MADTKTLLDLLEELVPDARLLVDSKTGNLNALALPADQAKIKSTIDTLQADHAGQNVPTLQVYVLEEEPSESLLDVIQSLAPEAEVTVDTLGKRLLVIATAEDHAAIQSTIEQVKAGTTPPGDPLLEVYSLDALGDLDVDPNPTIVTDKYGHPITTPSGETVGSQLIETLQTMAPDARLTIDTAAKKLIAWATPPEHEIIRSTVEKLDRGPGLERTPQLEVFRIATVDAQATLELLKSMVPEARLSLDSQTGSLISLAVSADQQVIRGTLEQLQPGMLGLEAPVLRFYPLLDEPPAGLTDVLEKLAPTAQVIVDDENQRLVVLASPAEHEIVRATVEEVQNNTPLKQPRKLVVYPVASAQRKRLEAVLDSLKEELPDIEVIAGDEPGELAVWAKPTEHLMIEDVLKQLDQQPAAGEKPQLIAYTITSADPDSVLEVLGRLFPDVDFVLDPKTNRLMAWAPLDQHQSISSALQQMDNGTPGGFKETFKVYPIPDVDADVVIDMLEELLPDVKLAHDATAGTILAWGRESDQEIIAQTIEQMKTAADGTGGPKAVVYQLKEAEAETAIDILELAVPEATFKVGDDHRQLIAWARPAEHQVIEETVAAIDVEGSGVAGATAVIYTLDVDDYRKAYYIGRFLRDIVPEASFTPGMEDNQLVAYASEEDHTIIAQMIERLAGGDTQRTVAVYTLAEITAKVAEDVLEKTVPKADFTTGDNPRQLIAWATAEDHATIKETLSAVDVEGPADDEAVAAAYTLEGASSKTSIYALKLLQSAVPEAKISVGTDPTQLIVWARPDDQEVIQTLVEQLSGQGSPETAPRLEIYDLGARTTVAVTSLLRSAVPDANLTAGDDPHQLIAWARPAEQEVIRAVIDKLLAVDPEESLSEAVVHNLRWTTAAVATKILQRAVPEVEVTPGADPQQLIVWARPEDQQLIEKTLTAIDVEGPGQKDATAVIYTLGSTDSRANVSIVRFLDLAVPKASLSLGPQAGQMVAWASPEDHQLLAALVDQLSTDESPETAPRLDVYALDKGDALSAISVLTPIVPEAQLSVGSDPGQLVVWARPEDHESIVAALARLSETTTADTEPRMEIYALENTDALSMTKMLVGAFPDAQLSVGSTPDQIIAWARPLDHEKIKQAVARLSQGEPSETAPSMEIYTLDGADSLIAAGLLAKIVPDAQITVGSDVGQLVVWARPADHLVIASTIEKLATAAGADTAPTAVVYTLAEISYKTAQPLLAKAVPQAEFTPGETPQQLIGWARPLEHESIKQTLAAIDVEAPADQEATAMIYTLESTDVKTNYYISRFLQQVVPEARFTPGMVEGQMVAWATAEDHEKIEKLIEEFSGRESAETAPRVAVYTLKEISATSAIGVLKTAVPEAQINAGDDPGQLIAFARPAEHEEIDNVLTVIDVKGPAGEEAVIAAYRLEGASSSSAIYAARLLESAVPEAKITTGTDRTQLIVWAKPEDQEVVRKLIDQLSGRGSPETMPKLVVYDLGDAMPKAVTSVLRSAVPDANVSEGGDPSELVVWARPDEHEVVRSVVDQMSVVDPDAPVPEAVVYSLEEITATVATSVLAKAVPQAEVTPGTDPQQLIVWARPEDQAVVKATIDKIDVEGVGAEDLTATIYTLASTDPRINIYLHRFITGVVPDANIILGPQPGQLIAWASPEDHQVLARVIQQLSAEESAETAPSMEIYTLQKGDVLAAIGILQSIVPEAQLSPGENPAQLIAWARPLDHQKIEAAVTKLSEKLSDEDRPRVEIYTLEAVDALSASKILLKAFPDSQFSVGSAADQLIVWARPVEHDEIRLAVERLAEGESPETAPVMEVYSLDGADPLTASAVLKNVVPEAQITVGDDAGQLMAWARPLDHLLIRSTLDKLVAAMRAETAPTAVVYTLAEITAEVAEEILTKAVPQAEFTIGDDSQQLTAWARPLEHELIKETIAAVDVEGPGLKNATAVIYDVGTKDYRRAYYIGRFLKDVVPEASFTPGMEDNQLVAFADAEDHAMIAQMIEELTGGDSPASVEVYTLKEISATSAIAVLAMSVPDVQLEAGDDPGRLIAFALPDEHEAIAKTLSVIDVKGPVGQEAVIAAYRLEGSSSSAAIYAAQLLESAVPEAKITAGLDRTQLIVWAKPEDQEIVKQLIDQLSGRGSPETMPKLVVYDLGDAMPKAVTSVLRSAVPDANVSEGGDPSELVVWARPDEHEVVRSVVDQMSVVDPDAPVPEAVVYSLEEITATVATSVLAKAVPQAEVTPGTDPQQLIVWARPEDQAVVKATIDKIDVEGVGAEDLTATIYTLASTDPRINIYLHRFITGVVPDANIILGPQPGQLIAWASPEDHQVLARVIQQLSAEESAETAPSMEIYTLQKGDVLAAIGILQSIVPEAQLSPGENPAQLIAWARPLDHQKIEAAVTKLSEKLSDEDRPRVEIYTLEAVDALSASKILLKAFPDSQFSVGSAADQLIVWARPVEHDEIRLAVERLAEGESPETAPVMEVYSLDGADPLTASAVLKNVVPEAQITVGDDAGQLMAWARPLDHLLIRSTLDKLVAAMRAETAPTAVVYTLAEITAEVAEEILTKAVPQAEFTIGDDSQQLTAWARPLEHELIKETIASIDVKGPAGREATAVAYTLEGASKTTAIYASRLIESAVPTARISTGIDATQLIAWARPEDHEVIRVLVEQLSGRGDAATAPRMEVYDLGPRAAESVLTVLKGAVPEAELTVGEDQHQLIAWARPYDHEIIRGVVDKLSVIDPNEPLPEAVVYGLKWTTAAVAAQILESAVPQAQITPAEDPQQLIAWALPEDQKLIAKTLQAIDVEDPSRRGAKAVLYTLKTTDPRMNLYVVRFLSEVVPDASFTFGAEPGQLIAWALPEDHLVLADLIQQLSADEPAETAPRMEIYRLEHGDAAEAITVLAAIVPEARLSAGNDPGQLIAWARPDDHEKIRGSLEKLVQEGPPESEPSARTYSLESTGVAEAIRLLQAVVPQAQLTAGVQPDQLVAWARPADHEIIAEIVEKMVDRGPAETAPRIVVYDLETTGAAAAMDVLRAAVVGARFGIGSDPSKLMVWARPHDHELIASAVEQFEADSWLAGNRVMAVYPIEDGSAESLLDVLDPTLRDHAQFVVDEERNSLIVWADKKYHDTIADAVQQFTEGIAETDQLTSKVYRFHQADASAAYRVLQTLVPEARIAYDTANRSLVASAMPEDHEKIAATIAEMEREDPFDQSPVVKVHRVTTADPYNLLAVLKSLFRQNPDVELSLDAANDSVIAFASPLEQEKIAELIAEVEKGAMLDATASLVLYSMQDVDTGAAMEILNNLLEKRGARADISIEPDSNQLVVLARSDVQLIVAEVVEQLRGEESIVEIYQLDYLDPYVADMAIGMQYDYSDPNRPDVDVDQMTQQLFIRARRPVHDEIRTLLVKMGELRLAVLPGGGSSSRVIPFSGDVNAVLEEIKRVWPQLRSNEIQVIPEEPETAEETEPSADQKEDSGESNAAATDKRPAEEPAPKPKKQRKKRAASEPVECSPWQFVSDEVVDDREATEQPTKRPTIAARSQKGRTAGAESKKPQPGAPVIVIPGEDKITVRSDDPEALDQFESLLQILSQPGSPTDRTLSVYQLKHTSATFAADKINEILLASPFGLRGGYATVSVVPDDRLNTLLVQGSRLDRQRVESLLEVVDVEPSPEVAEANKPRIIAILNMEATEVEDVIREVFRSYFGSYSTSSKSSKSSRAATPSLPLGLAPQLSVERITNSLVVRAPAPLIDDIVQLATRLDEEAGLQRARGLKIIPMQKFSAERMEEALEAILKGQRGNAVKRK